MKTTLLVLALAASTVSIASPVEAAACTYQSTPLPNSGLNNGRLDYLTIASRVGDVYAGSYSSESALLWKDGTVTNLGTFAGATEWLEPTDVNSRGTVVGYGETIAYEDSEGTDYEFHPFRSRGGHLEQLPLPAGVTDVKAVLVDEHDDVYGQYHEQFAWSNHPNTIFKWPADRPGTVETLAGFPTDREPILRDIDADGTIAYDTNNGGLTETISEPRAYLWRNGVSTRLGTGGSTYQHVAGVAGGVAVGLVYDANRVAHGTVWDAAGAPHAMANGDKISIDDVNASGRILGYTPATDRSSLWQGTARVTELAASQWPAAVTADGSLVGGHQGSPRIWRCG